MPNHDQPLEKLKSVVLVTGQFNRGASGLGFASIAWKKIDELYKKNYWQRNRTNATRSKRTEVISGEPLLAPVRLDDRGDAGTIKFRDDLYNKMKQFNVCGIVSCCTAENSSKLLDVLDPIDVPILLALDNTVERATLTKPNILQLIPNNALQAQAILSKVGGTLPDGEDKITVNVYLWPPQNDFVRDLWKALVEKSNEAQNSRINLNPISVGSTLKEIGARLKKEDVIVYIGYYDGLEKLISLVNSDKVILSDACAEQRVRELMKREGRSYYLSKPSLDPSVYACQGYLALSKVWIESRRESADWSLARRLQSPALLVRSRLESLFTSYRFVGATNQSGGYVVRKFNQITMSKHYPPAADGHRKTHSEAEV